MTENLTPAQLAEPTPADVAERLAADAQALRTRLDDYAGPLTDTQRRELVLLAQAAMDLHDGR